MWWWRKIGPESPITPVQAFIVSLVLYVLWTAFHPPVLP